MSLPSRFLFLVATLAQFGLIVTLWLVPIDYLSAYLVPEMALRQTHIFIGPRFVYDVNDLQVVPPPIVAWRRLTAARDTAAFRRMTESGSVAGQLYAVLGLRALNAAVAMPLQRAGTDSVELNMHCREIQTDGQSAAREVFASVSPHDLLTDPVICR